MITSQFRTIDAADLGHLQDHVAKINRKIKTEGQGYSVIELARGTRELKRESLTHIGCWDIVGYVATVDVEVRGVAPRIAGWSFVGTLTWDHGDCVVNTIPGLPEVGDARPSVEICDHCSSRRYRKATYLLRNEDGEYKQVGSSCLKDFLGHSVNLALVGVNVFEGCDSTNRYEPEQLSSLRVLMTTMAAYRTWGWTSASKARELGTTSTRNSVADVLWGNSSYDQQARTELAAHVRDDDELWATRIIEWARQLDGKGDYELNLKAALGADTFRADNLGLVVAAPATYKRALAAQRVAEQASTTTGVSTHQGELKERLRSLQLVVTGLRYIEGDYGVTTLVLMKDAAGNAYKWWASNSPELDEGDKLLLDGTVKDHEVYNGLASTVLTRCKLLTVAVAA